MDTHIHPGQIGNDPSSDQGLLMSNNLINYWNGNPIPFTTEPVTLPEGAP